MAGYDWNGYLLAKLVISLFKNRLSCAFYAFVSIVALVIGIMLLRAQSRDELTFPVLGLAFTLIVVVSRVIHDIRQNQIKDFHEVDETLLDLDQEIQQIEETTIEPEPLQLFVDDRSNQTIFQPEISLQATRSVHLRSPRVKYPNLRATEVLLLLVTATVFLGFGYVAAHHFFANTMIALFAQSSDPISTAEMTEWAADYINNFLIQLIIATPLVILLAFIMAGVAFLLLRRLLGFGLGALTVTIATAGLVLGFIIYFPTQFLIIIAAAF